MQIILECVREGTKKLRIRFHSYIDVQENRTYTNVYNNKYNCTFPKDIRVEGRLYEVPDTDIQLIHYENKAPYYGIKRSNIRIISDPIQVSCSSSSSSSIEPPTTLFDAGECVVCLSEPSICIYVPCGHMCVCASCNYTLNSMNPERFKCPVCRAKIKSVIMDKRE